MKYFFSFYAFFLFVAMHAQHHPQYVPFKFGGETGIMNISGAEYKEPGYLNDFGNYYVAGDFQTYIINKNEDSDFVMNALSGKEILSGKLDTDCGPLKIGNDNYYHFKLEGSSALFAAGKHVIMLNGSYLKIEPNAHSWDNEFLNDKQFIWALKNDNTYDILDVNRNFSPVESLPSFKSFDLIFRTNKDAPPTLIGFALGEDTAIQREFGQQYGIPQSDKTVELYDLNFKKIGDSPYRQASVSRLFKTEIQFRGGMMEPPSLKNQIIRSDQKTVVLNQEFSLIPSDNQPGQLILVNTQKNSTPVLGNDKFDYRYISTSKNLKALLQIRHAQSGSFFYFDFNGTYFPKGIPMIPEKYRQWKQNK